MFNDLLHLYQFVDQTMSILFQRYPEEIMCKKGCTDCCNAAFDVSYIEGAFLLTAFRELPPDICEQILQRCQKAEKEWDQVLSGEIDPSRARIRCPLLNDSGQCSCYKARPVNCRTYGVPTIIKGSAHVCGLSKFSKGKSYPTVDLEPLQKSLYDYSVATAGDDLGIRRWPVSILLLHPDQLIAAE
ncbi:MAG: hypothetical protein KQH63_14845 [Desulfobulbaceae bacterium]|nr:hypothetical protein [Desulfobulbaceae bacterium]